MNDYYTRSEAQAQAAEVIKLIGDTCERVEVAGSIRRGKPHVSDAELVLIPKWNCLARLDRLVLEKRLRKAEYLDKNGHVSNRWGSKYRGVTLYDSDMKIELFLTTPDAWGYIFWLRTGPGGKNEQLVTALKYNSPFLAREGYIWLESGEALTTRSRKISVPDEHTFYRLLNLPYEEPHERGAGYDTLYWKSHTWGQPESFVQETIVPPTVQPKLF